MLRGVRFFAPGASASKPSEEQGEALRALRLLRACEEHGAAWFWETDADGRLSYVSPRVLDILKGTGLTVIGDPLTSVLRLDPDAQDVSRSLSFYLSSKSAFRDYPVRGEVGAEANCWSISGCPRFDSKGAFLGFSGSGHDLSERRRSQAAITRLAFSDTLTGLANRQRMGNALQQHLAMRTSGFSPTALLMLDLDRFKMVNDTLGHQTGDELLKQVAQRLTRVVNSHGLVGRLGGDEFQVILADDTVRATVDLLAQDIISSVSQPYFIHDTPISVGCSIGIAIAPEHGNSVEALVRSADLALYAAKDAGRGTHKLYSAELLSGAQARKQLEDELRDALANDQLHLAYQPVVSTADGGLSGFEALARWTHPVRGPVSPAEFIPLAEECGLIEQLGEWVLRTAVSQAMQWPDHVRIAVNVSSVQFANPQLATIVASALASAGLRADRLELELTESVFLADSESSDAQFQALKKLGVRLALDDFGTGYSSLGYLKSAPFDKIKIDQGFVRGAVASGNRNAAIVRAIVSLADALGMETTAEGVEQQDEIAFIRELGCTHIQGFVYGKPMLAEEVSAEFATGDGPVEPVGHRVSRAPRRKMFRSAKIRTARGVAEVHVRNASPEGVMIEGAQLGRLPVGAEVLLDLPEGQTLVGDLRWAKDGRAGLHIPSGIEDSAL